MRKKHDMSTWHYTQSNDFDGDKLQCPCLPVQKYMCYSARNYQKKKLKSQFLVQFLVDFTVFYCAGY